MRGEYYRADILAKAGLPVDQPILSSTLPGEQILVYRRRSCPRFSDVLWGFDLRPDDAALTRVFAAEAELNDRILKVARATLHPIAPEASEAELIHRLFHERLIEPGTRRYPGGRLALFHVGQEFRLPGMTLDWASLSSLQPVLNGLTYSATISQLFAAAQDRINPARLANAGGVAGHGDAHNANVWYQCGGAGDRLSFFDPALAGSNVPSLLSEVKATFHDTLVHPFWRYDSSQATRRFRTSVRIGKGTLSIDTDWELGVLRNGLLRIKAERFWKAWLAELRGRGLLPDDWEQVIRLALFLCPTLVMNLRAGPGGGAHSPETSALGLLVAIMAGSAPLAGQDCLTRFFDQIRPD